MQDCAAGIYIGLDVPVPGGLDCCITAGLMTNFCAGRATNETGLKDPNVGTNNVKVLPGVTRKAVAIDEGMPMYVIAGRKLTL